MSENIPPSQMLRVPSALVDAVKELSRLHRSGYTSAVVTGLQQLIAGIDSTADSVASVTAGKSDTELLAELISGLDERIATQVAAHVAQLEQRLSTQLGDLKPRHDDLRKLPDAWAEVSELRSQAEAQTRIAKEAETLAESQRMELEQIRQHRDELRLMLDDQATKAEQWYSRASEAENLAEQRWLEIERLQQRQSHLSTPPVAQSELLNTTPESQADQSEPLVAESEPLENTAIAAHPLEDIAVVGADHIAGDHTMVEDAAPVGGEDVGIAGDRNTLENIPAPAAPSNETVEGAAPSLRSLAPLTATELAKRLGVHQSSVSRSKDNGNEHFRGWTAERDPDSIAWEYREGGKRDPNFHPLA